MRSGRKQLDPRYQACCLYYISPLSITLTERDQRSRHPLVARVNATENRSIVAGQEFLASLDGFKSQHQHQKWWHEKILGRPSVLADCRTWMKSGYHTSSWRGLGNKDDLCGSDHNLYMTSNEDTRIKTMTESRLEAVTNRQL
jgi:hypothetical protein